MRAFALCAVSLFTFCEISGCVPAPDETIDTVFDPCARVQLDVDDDASAAQRESVRDAMRMWNGEAATALEQAETDDRDDPIDEGDDVKRVPLHFDPAGTSFHGYYDDERGVVYINEGIREDRARTLTVAHELGHAFGMHHVDREDRPSLMNEGNTSVGLTREDVAALEALWGACER